MATATPVLTKPNGEIVPLTLGCVFASPRGHYIGRDVVQAAVSLGWDDADAVRAADSYEESWDHDWEFFDAWYDIVDNAVQYLNDHTTGAVWDWFDGDFMVQDSDWWEENQYL